MPGTVIAHRPAPRRTVAGLTAVVLALGAVAAGGFSAPGADAAEPRVIVVGTTEDQACRNPLPAAPSLRQALCHAVAARGEWRIEVPEGDYRIDGRLDPLRIETPAPGSGMSIEIVGAGVDKTVLDGQGTTRILEIDRYGQGGFSVTLTDLTLRDAAGDAWGGAIQVGSGALNAADLTLRDCAVTGSTVDGWGLEGWGGGAVNMDGGGDLTVERCTFSGNSATDSTGGAISWTTHPGAGSLTITGSTFIGNSATVSGGPTGGGAVFASGSGTVTITGSTFVDNSATGSSGVTGGAVRVESGVVATITGSLLEGNVVSAGAGSASGGALHLADSADVTASVFHGNTNPAVSAAGAFTTADVWWDCLDGPVGGTSACQTTTTQGAGTVSHGPFIGLGLAADPPSDPPGAMGITATVTRTPSGLVPSGVLALLAGRILSWATDSGAVTPAETPFPVTGTSATALWAAGTATVRATLLGVTPEISVTGPPAVPAQVVAHPADTTVVAGSQVTFSGTATGTPAPTATWQVSGDGETWSDLVGDVTTGTVDGLTTSELALTAGVDDHGHRYRVVFSNETVPDGATATSDSALLTVHTAPVITAQPEATTVLVGASATFTVAASGRPDPTVRWQRCEHGVCQDVPGATDQTLIVPAVDLADSGARFRAVVTNGVGDPVTSDEAALTVQMGAELVDGRLPADATVHENSRVTFTATARGVPAPSASWWVSQDGGLSWLAATGDVTTDTVDGVTTTELAVIATAGDHGNQYAVNFWNRTVTGVVSTTSRHATLTVHTAPVITAQPEATTVMVGASATFTVAVSGRPTPEVQWQECVGGACTDMPGATGPTLTMPTVPYDARDRSYRAVARNEVGQVSSAEVALTVHRAAQVTADPEGLTVREGEDAWFEASGVGSPTPAVTWQVSQDDGVTWDEAVGEQTTTPGSTPGELDWRIEVPASEARDGDRYRVHLANSIVTGPVAVLSAEASLVVDVPPTIMAEPHDLTVLAGRVATFTVGVAGRPAPTVQWLRCDGAGAACAPIAGATAPTLTLPAELADSGSTVRAVVTNRQGSVSTRAAVLTVHLLPEVSGPGDLTADEGGTVVLAVEVTGEPAPTLTWQRWGSGGWTDLAATEARWTLGPLTRTDDGVRFRAVATNAAGTAVGAEAVLAVAWAAEVSDPADVTVEAGAAAVFSVAVDGNPAPRVRWETSPDGVTWTPVAGGTGTELTVTAAAALDGARFRAVATNVIGAGERSAASRPAVLHLVPADPDADGGGGLGVTGADLALLGALAAALLAAGVSLVVLVRRRRPE